MRVLIFGQSGQVARALAQHADGDARKVEAIRTLGRSDLDLSALDLAAVEARSGLDTMPAGLAASLTAFAPTHVVNAAAYTAVDLAESDPEAAFRLNRDAAGFVASLAGELSSALIHISTDYVYDGTKNGPYLETDRTSPRSIYGASKLAGEGLVMARHPGAVILRTAWIYAPVGRNFVKTMLRLAGERSRLSVVCDQVGCPTSASDLAAAILALMPQIPAGGSAHGKSGIFHAVAAGEASWHGFAEAIFEISRRLGGPWVPVDPISSEAYPTPARRPVNSRLCCEKLRAVFGVTLPPWKTGLEACLKDLLQGRQAEDTANPHPGS